MCQLLAISLLIFYMLQVILWAILHTAEPELAKIWEYHRPMQMAVISCNLAVINTGLTFGLVHC